MAIGQWAAPAAAQNTPQRHTKPPPYPPSPQHLSEALNKVNQANIVASDLGKGVRFAPKLSRMPGIAAQTSGTAHVPIGSEGLLRGASGAPSCGATPLWSAVLGTPIGSSVPLLQTC